MEETAVADTTKIIEPIKPVIEKEPPMVSPKKRRVLERNIPQSPPPVVQTRTRRGRATATTEQETIVQNPVSVNDRKTRSKQTNDKMQVSKILLYFIYIFLAIC